MSFESLPASGAKKGANWTYKIYFIPEADKISSCQYEIEDEELFGKLQTLLDVNETVDYVWAYKHDLFSWLPHDLNIFYHMFILFKTHDWWWSIEKNSEGLTIQRSKVRDAVLNNYRRVPRPSTKELINDTGCRSIMDLIVLLFKSNELNKEYHYLDRNCQDFARAVFNYMATSKRL
jgi:hypothetical protein